MLEQWGARVYSPDTIFTGHYNNYSLARCSFNSSIAKETQKRGKQRTADLLCALGHLVRFLLMELLGLLVRVFVGQSVVALLRPEWYRNPRVNRRLESRLCGVVGVELGHCLALVSSHRFGEIILSSGVRAWQL